MSRDEMSALQGKRLNKLVNLVYHNVPFYRNKMQEMDLSPDDIQTIEDIVKLPFTTKQDLRDNYPYGLQAAPASEIVRVHASSGTTGNPTIVGYTRRDLSVWSEVMSRCLSAYGVTRNDTFSVSYGYGLFTGGLGAHYGVENLGATVIPASTGNTEKHVRLIRDLGITGIACTPSYALYLAEVVERMGLTKNDINLRIGAFGAEPWTESMRKEIEERLGLKGYNIYGLSEIMGPGVSYECQEQHGSHINEDHFYPEIINPETLERLPDGEVGELVFTTLTKEGMPLLRYRTKDLTSLMEGECPCGRTNIRMSGIVGRSDDMLIIRGINVFPSQVESVILDMPQFEPQYMLVVDRKNNLDSLQVQVEVRKDFFSDDMGSMLAMKKALSDKLKSVLSISAEVKLMEPNSIARSEGKSKRVIDNRILKIKKVCDMTIKQLSVFLENKTGRINDVTKTLAKYDINMHAFSMAESTDFGILRLIVSDVEKAVEVLRAENFAVMLTDVVCISCPNVAGSLAKVLDYLAAENIFIEYMYAFAQGDTAHVVIRPSNVERCVEILNKFNCNVLTKNSL